MSTKITNSCSEDFTEIGNPPEVSPIKLIETKFFLIQGHK